MPALRRNLHIYVELDGKKWSSNGARLRRGKFLMKRGRSWSTKKLEATTTEITNLLREWIVANDTDKIGYEVR